MNTLHTVAGPCDYPRNPLTGKPAGRISSHDVAPTIPCREDQVSTLIKHGLLKPLGQPAVNAARWFSVRALQAALADESWLSEVTRVLSERDHTRSLAKADRTGRATQRLSRRNPYGAAVEEHALPQVGFTE